MGSPLGDFRAPRNPKAEPYRRASDEPIGAIVGSSAGGFVLAVVVMPARGGRCYA
jgi:hypothetical protein